MNLKKIRNNHGLSIRALSELANVPQRTIEDIERFDRCKVDTAIKLADAWASHWMNSVGMRRPIRRPFLCLFWGMGKSRPEVALHLSCLASSLFILSNTSFSKKRITSNI